MFYSHDILTRKSNGLSTAWLVATLGAKSSLKRVYKKDILGVSIPDACDVVMHPPQPLALRLSASLLYGLIHIYAQKSGFLFDDVSTAYTKITRAILDVHQNEARLANDLHHTKASRPDQLVLQDDPAFSIDFGFLGNDFLAASQDTFPEDLGITQDYNHQADRNFIGAYNIDPSSDLPDDASFSSNPTSAYMSQSGVLSSDPFEMPGFDDDLGQVSFEFSHNGNVIDFDYDDNGIGGGGSGAGGAAQSSGQRAYREMVFNDDDSFDHVQPIDPKLASIVFDYDANMYPTIPEIDDSIPLVLSSTPAIDNVDEDPAIKSKYPKKRKAPSLPTVDEVTELSNDILRSSRDEYTHLMATETESARAKRVRRYVMKNSAPYFVFGGDLIGDLYSDISLAYPSVLPGGKSLSPPSVADGDIDTDFDDNDYENALGDVPQGGNINSLPIDFDGDVEDPRQLSTELPYMQSSSLLPWNISVNSNNNNSMISTASASHQHSLALHSSTDNLFFTNRQRRSSSSGLLRNSGGQRKRSTLIPSDLDSHAEDAEYFSDSDGITLRFFLIILSHSLLQNIYSVSKIVISTRVKSLEFSAILSQQENSQSVASQGFLHVLTLASVGALSAEQSGPGSVTVSVADLLDSLDLSPVTCLLNL
ncbi:Rec8 like protein-domain-containing protein [Myxozyma melibiosi]|uniref:Rec8 like protein-domain-containing protein n=1 Tax=Myxozyma melibiosi TaxID=54550 RepID=A0ABR1F3R8_9ASCO